MGFFQSQAHLSTRKIIQENEYYLPAIQVAKNHEEEEL